MKPFFFIVRTGLAYLLLYALVAAVWGSFASKGLPWLINLAFVIAITWSLVSAFSHVRRVRLIADRVDSDTLGSRHRRQIEIPFEAGEAFDLVDAAIRELPHVESIESARDSLQVRARVRRMNPYTAGSKDRKASFGAYGIRHNQVLALVTPGEGVGTLNLVCEPDSGAWVDWFMVDDGTNLENAEAITRAITRRVSERRRLEQAETRQTATEKELTVAKLSLLHAQVEPHFLYNTLASAQYLTRSDPAKADEMLGNLITYLRNSLPRAEDSLSTLGEELERARAYLEILKLRMGERLTLHIEIPAELKPVVLPAMMLQTLVENAIKHGLEPVTGGGSIWVLARRDGDEVSVTVADDGRGFHTETSGTGIGLKNIRERLKLVYGDGARFAIVANFPKGVAATITVPFTGPRVAA